MRPDDETNRQCDARTQTLYRFYDAEGILLYVGITGNLPLRLPHHNASKPWWADVAYITLEHFPERASAEAAETHAIQTEGPRHNVANVIPEIETGTPRRPLYTPPPDRRADATWPPYRPWSVLVYLGAIMRIREAVSGVPYLRALGLYGVLCWLALEQAQYCGQSIRVRVSYRLLEEWGCQRSRVDKDSLRCDLEALCDAGVTRIENASGSTFTMLLYEDVVEPITEPWTWYEPEQGYHLRASDATTLLEDLGLLLTLLQIYEETRPEGLLRSEPGESLTVPRDTEAEVRKVTAVTREELATRCGLAGEVLERRCQVLEVKEALRNLSVKRDAADASCDLFSYEVLDTEPHQRGRLGRKRRVDQVRATQQQALSAAELKQGAP